MNLQAGPEETGAVVWIFLLIAVAVSVAGRFAG